MKNTIVLYFILVFGLLKSFSQESLGENVVGENFSINSQILNEEREIQIFLPKDYAQTNKNYPVIYLLDGQRFFLYGVSLYQSFVEFKQTPEFILVGVTNVQSNRMQTFSAGASNFFNYLEKEVIPFIDSKYRTSKKRLLYGWAYGGGFGLETLMAKPKLFDGYIISSPYPVSSKIEKFNKFLSKNKTLDTFLYFSSDINEFGVKEGTEELKENLTNNTATKLRWRFRELVGEGHLSTPYTTLYHGIKEYFENYNEISFKDLKEFYEKGGMLFVKEYYRKRSKLYNLPDEMSVFTKYNITRLAIRADNYDQFDAFVNGFNKNEFIYTLRINWACTIADFYLKNNKYKKAIEMFSFITDNNPKSTRSLNGLGDSYLANGEKKAAIKSYKKSISLDSNQPELINIIVTPIKITKKNKNVLS
ncbi:MAG: putative alpha/beta superfamily hydrolase/TfoX [Polaribacter sp.]|jgi:predicted alpha/beta superfamily hydrolase/TfoX/Sxy family transcriptional regulator of competence genes